VEVVVPEQTVVFKVPQLGILTISGPDSETFLHGQLTCEVRNLQSSGWFSGGYCNPQGKLISNFHAKKQQDTFFLVLESALLESTLTQLKKYAVFSKVEIHDRSSSYELIAHWGQQLNETESENLLHPTLALTLQDATDTEITLVNSPNLWQQATFAIGWFSVPLELSQEHLPQVFNLDLQAGISFKKGCYIGQEPIARMHYRGQTKRRAARFIGQAHDLPSVNNTLLLKVGENWRRAGAILSAVRYDGEVVALVALASVDIEEAAEFRIEGQDDSQFTHCPLKT